MKIKIIQDFIDRETKELAKYGAEIEVTEDRSAELIGKGFAEEVKTRRGWNATAEQEDKDVNSEKDEHTI